jgi:aspartyl-tRNA(Asn)/glutamyl-tRNA(Gln) amidotransferase subunit B
LPQAKAKRFAEEYGLKAADVEVLTASRETADFFEAVTADLGDAKLAANWVTGELGAALNRAGIEITESRVNAAALAGLLKRIQDSTISGKIAKDVFAAMWDQGGNADSIIETQGLKQITDTGAIEAAVDDVIVNNPEQVAQFRAGKDKVLGFLVGQVMKATQGKANPGQVNQILRDKLSS